MMKSIWIVLLLTAFPLLTMAAEPEKSKDLTLQEAVTLALKNNVNLQIQVSDSEVSQYQLQYQKGSYIPRLGLKVDRSQNDSPASDIFAGESDTNSSSEWRGTFTISQKIPSNGVLSLRAIATRATDSSTRTTIDPSLTSSLALNFSQPLIKGFGLLSANKEIRVAANNMESSQHQLKQAIIDLAYEIENAYWNLVYAYQNLEARKTSLQLSQDLLRQNEIKVKVGTAAPIEILEAKADVANYEGQLIQAEKDIQSRDEELKRLLNLSRDDMVLLPSERPQVEPQQVDLNAFLEEALQGRPDMQRAQLAMKNQGIEVSYQRNQNLPDLQLVAQYVAYGQGGTQVDRYPPFTDASELKTRTFWDAVEDTLKRKYNGFSVSLDLKIPVVFKQEKAQLAIAKLNFEKALLTLKNTENTVYSEVKQVIKELETNRKLAEANRISVDLYEQKLKAEEKKLSVGLSTNFQVLQYLGQFTDAQNRALQSQISYKLTLARMNKILGRTLKAYNITLSDVDNVEK